jgi:hypothetical protein
MGLNERITRWRAKEETANDFRPVKNPEGHAHTHIHVVGHVYVSIPLTWRKRLANKRDAYDDENKRSLSYECRLISKNAIIGFNFIDVTVTV